MDKMVFQADFAFGFNGVLPAKRLSILGASVSSTGGYVVVMAVFLVLIGWAVLLLRRGVVGRMLIAMRDSTAACGTLGLDVRWFRVGLFALSAGVAGVAGALFAGLRQTVGAGDFIYFNSLQLVLFAAVCGFTSISGATLGGVAMMALPQLQSAYPSIGGLLYMGLAVGAILLAKEPYGLVIYLFRLGRLLERRITPAIRANLPSLPGGGRGDQTDVDDHTQTAASPDSEGVPAHAH
jgi:branched-chain amino acid transport system permease protein